MCFILQMVSFIQIDEFNEFMYVKFKSRYKCILKLEVPLTQNLDVYVQALPDSVQTLTISNSFDHTYRNANLTIDLDLSQMRNLRILICDHTKT